MGRGIDLARDAAPEHAQMMEDLRDQLLIAFLRRLNGKVEMPATEIDETGGYLLLLSLDPDTRVFTFELRKKQ